MSNSLSVAENTLKGSISAADASTMLLRLAGKQPPKKGETAIEQKDKHKGKRRPSAKHESISSNEEKVADKTAMLGSYDEDLQDWYTDELDEAALSNFRDLFNMLDQSKTGIITAENLYEELRRVDSEITYSEVEDVLKKVDKDGNGEIDFDEFLMHMTNMGGDLFGDEEDDEEQRKMKSRRKRMFYKAITCFSIKQTLADIEKQFRKHAPHVISHYTAGVRLIGLTTRQLERQMKRMQRSAAKNDSPYAKPLQFVQLSRKGKKNIVHRKKTKTRKEMPGSCRDLQQKESVETEHDPAVGNLTKEIQDTMMMFAQKEGSLVPQDANIIMQLRKKLGSVTAKIREKKLQTTEECDHSNISTIPALNKPKSAVVIKKIDEKKSPTSLLSSGTQQKGIGNVSAIEEEKERKWKRTKKNFMLALGWTTPRIQYIDVPLPSLKMQLSEKPTFNDLHRIRAKAKQAIDAYYHDLRQTEIRNAWNHWDRLYADVIEPEKLLKNFRTVYSAYSPHREEEAFVVCPWKPGPFCILRHIQKPPVVIGQKSPNITITGNALHKSYNIVHPKTVPNTLFRSIPSNRNTPSPIGRPCSSLADAKSGSSLKL